MELGGAVFRVGDRLVKVVTGRRTQTVNVCTPDGRAGEYEFVVRIRPPFADPNHLDAAGFESVDSLLQHLISHFGGELERSPASRVVQLRPPTLVEQLPPTPWEEEAQVAVEWAIDQLVDEFVESPYLHRCEHSLHCRLYELLMTRPELNEVIGFGRWRTQSVHKEWPEYRPRPGKRGRGNFDLAILSPDSIQIATLDSFLNGRIRPSFAIELGLDYGLDHLTGDIAKFRNSAIRGSYLVHFVREGFVDDHCSVESNVLDCGIRSAYCRHTYGCTYFKYVADDSIRELPIVAAE